MSEAEKTGTVFLNRGLRHFDLAPDADGKPRRHSPGQQMEYSAEEAKSHVGYTDLIDIAKVPGREDARKLKAEKAALESENEALKARLAALEPKKKSPKVEAPAVEEAKA